MFTDLENNINIIYSALTWFIQCIFVLAVFEVISDIPVLTGPFFICRDMMFKISSFLPAIVLPLRNLCKSGYTAAPITLPLLPGSTLLSSTGATSPAKDVPTNDELVLPAVEDVSDTVPPLAEESLIDSDDALRPEAVTRPFLREVESGTRGSCLALRTVMSSPKVVDSCWELMDWTVGPNGLQSSIPACDGSSEPDTALDTSSSFEFNDSEGVASGGDDDVEEAFASFGCVVSAAAVSGDALISCVVDDDDHACSGSVSCVVDDDDDACSGSGDALIADVVVDDDVSLSVTHFSPCEIESFDRLSDEDTEMLSYPNTVSKTVGETHSFFSGRCTPRATESRAMGTEYHWQPTSDMSLCDPAGSSSRGYAVEDMDVDSFVYNPLTPDKYCSLGIDESFAFFGTDSLVEADAKSGDGAGDFSFLFPRPDFGEMDVVEEVCFAFSGDGFDHTLIADSGEADVESGDGTDGFSLFSHLDFGNEVTEMDVAEEVGLAFSVDEFDFVNTAGIESETQEVADSDVSCFGSREATPFDLVASAPAVKYTRASIFDDDDDDEDDE
ncbi:hypothetical protein MFLAVUS_008375 [Mucor flavus]|uniref:Uncharacterized protein n=1 Tax=Mucor flavus TaxID=439312 RepID=A0ABP9Z729_9FUNG